MNSINRHALRIAAIYVVCSILWIVFSDRLLIFLVTEVSQRNQLQTAKGLGFVLLTAVLLYYLIARVFRARLVTEGHLLELQRIIDRSPVVAMAWKNEPGWPVCFVNDSIRQWGYCPEQLLEGRLSFAQLIHPDDVTRVEQEVVRHLAQGPDDYTQEYRLKTAAGQWVWVSDRTWVERDAEGRVMRIRGVLQDVTLIQQSQARLEASEGRLRALVTTIPDLVWLKDMDGVYLSCNSVFERLFGAKEAEIVGKTDHDFVDRDLADFFRDNDRKAMEKGGPSINEEWLTFAEDGRQGLFETIKTPVLDAHGHLVGVLGIAREVTQARESQEALRRLTQELEQRVAERTAELEALNRELEAFSYSVSHDLKAPLRSIDGYSQLLHEDYRGCLNEEGQLFLQRIRQGVTQMYGLIEDLLAYSRMERRPLESAPVDVLRLLDDLLKDQQDALMAAGLEVQLQTPASLTLAVDREGLTIALRNLLENAIKFGRGGQPPLIQVRLEVQEPSPVQEGHTGLVRFIVQDHGIGLDMKYHDRIFKIFQRLHRAEDYPGTGIGLALVSKAMQRMGGRVWAESVPGSGATFYLELPQ